LNTRVRAGGLLEVLGALLSIATVVGFLGGWYWLADLFAHFRAQYFVGLSILTGIFALLPGRRFVALLFGCLALINAAVLAPLYVPRAAATVPAAAAARLIVQNVNTNAGDPRKVAAFIREERPDIAALVEVNDAWLSALSVLNEDYPYRVLEPRPGRFGVALYSRLPIEDRRVEHPGDGPPAIVARLRIGNRLLTVVACHPPPPIGGALAHRRDAALAALPALVHGGRPSVLVGDLNTTRFGAHFQTLLEDSGLKDSGPGFGLQPTWPVGAPPLLPLSIAIDHFLHSPDVEIVDRRLGPDVGSDHRGLVVDFRVR